jgi:hypothetical protein
VKKLCLFSVVLVLCFTSCFRTVFLDSEEERIDVPDVPNTTFVQFDNKSNQTVRVFTSFDRHIQSGIVEVPPNTISSPLDWFPTTERYSFHLTYHLNLSNIIIPYHPINTADISSIKRSQTTTIIIPPLHIVSPVSGPLVSDIYFAIQNNGFLSVSLARGTSVGQDVNGNFDIDHGTTGLYIVPAGSTPYRLMVGANNFDLPSVTATNGHLYIFTFNGTGVVLNNTVEITLANIR